MCGLAVPTTACTSTSKVAHHSRWFTSTHRRPCSSLPAFTDDWAAQQLPFGFWRDHPLCIPRKTLDCYDPATSQWSVAMSISSSKKSGVTVEERELDPFSSAWVVEVHPPDVIMARNV